MKQVHRRAVAVVGPVLLSGRLAAGAAGQEVEEGPREDRGWTMTDPLALEGDGWRVELGGYGAVDAVKYRTRNERDSGLELKDADLEVEAWYEEDLHFLVRADLVGVDTPRNLWEAWAGLALGEHFAARAGQIRVALNTELATHVEDLPVYGYGFPSYLDGRYDVGAALTGQDPARRVWFEAAATLGEGFGLEGRRLSSRQLSLRAVGHPFRHGGSEWLQGFFVGGAVAYLSDFDDPVFVATPTESIVFTTADLDGDSGRWLHWEAGWQRDRFRTTIERLSGEANEVPSPAGEFDADQLTAWSWSASLRLLGPPATWDAGGWSAPWDAADREGGVVELGGRYSNADIDRSLFDRGLTTYDPSTQEVRVLTLSLQWLPIPSLRVSANWLRTIGDHELTTFGGSNRDTAWVLRAEARF